MSKLFIKVILIVLALITLLFLYARYIEPHRLTAVEVFAVNHKADENTGQVTIAVFADTHFSDIYSPYDFERAVDMMNGRNPDLILFCGDLIDNYKSYRGDTEEISRALSRLSAPLGKFAVYGNHDYGGGASPAYAGIMEAGGFRVLLNESVAFEHVKLVLIGLDDFVLGKGDINAVAEAARPDLFNLVFCHVPDVIDELLEYSVDLMVSGHTHGGQINIPGYKHSFFPPYGQNYHRGNYSFDNDRNTTLHVNSGLSTTQLPFRFMAPPEVTFICLNRDN